MNPRRIITIAVEKLFGIYDYTLKVPSVSDNVLIVYGDNGTGKSTILQLVYHLLSADNGSFHKTFVANVSFLSFKLVFEDGSVIEAFRHYDENDDLIGTFSVRFGNEGNLSSVLIPCEWHEESRRYLPETRGTTYENRSLYQSFLSFLNGYKVSFISDRRNDEAVSYVDTYRGRRQPMEDSVEKEMRLLHEWIIAKALAASKKGEEGTSGIYVKILSQFTRRKKKGTVKTLSELKQEVSEVDAKTKSYVKMGFISGTDYSDVILMFDKFLKKDEESVSNILVPYLEIQKNKLNALDDLVETIGSLVNSLNEYLFNKYVVYSVQNGFSFHQSEPESEIDVKMFSSGERQLLRLFGMVIRESDTSPIIIIDEPELSLNIKWQRRLLDTLNFFVRGSGAQFVIATHSFEILSRHINNTVIVGHPEMLEKEK